MRIPRQRNLAELFSLLRRRTFARRVWSVSATRPLPPDLRPQNPLRVMPSTFQQELLAIEQLYTAVNNRERRALGVALGSWMGTTWPRDSKQTHIHAIDLRAPCRRVWNWHFKGNLAIRAIALESTQRRSQPTWTSLPLSVAASLTNTKTWRSLIWRRKKAVWTGIVAWFCWFSCNRRGKLVLRCLLVAAA